MANDVRKPHIIRGGIDARVTTTGATEMTNFAHQTTVQDSKVGHPVNTHRSWLEFRPKCERIVVTRTRNLG